jgi:hypothetical protein
MPVSSAEHLPHENNDVEKNGKAILQQHAPPAQG